MSTSPRFQRLQALEAAAWLAAHPQALVLDAREARHHEQGHMPGSARLDGRNHERLLLSEPKDRPIFIYCYHGNASQAYADMFIDFGFAKVTDLLGGWEAWRLAGLNDAAPVPKATPNAALQHWLQAQGLRDAHTPGAHGNTPLMVAAWRGDAAAAQALLAEGVNLTAQNDDGNNALWLACMANDPALVSLLAKAGVPIDHVNATGATSLMYASSSSKPDIVKTLLALGADPSVRTQDDFSAMDMAASLECLYLLRHASKAASQGVA